MRILNFRSLFVICLIVLAGALFLPLLANAQSTGIHELDDALEQHTAGNLKEAVEAYTEVLKKHPRSPEAFNWRGMAYDDLGELDKALADLNQAIELSPNYADAYNNRGEVYRKKKMFPQATGDFQKAVQLEPNFAEAYYNLGLVFETGEKKLPQAAVQYDQYLKHAPKAIDRETVSEKIKELKTAAASPSQAAKPLPGAPAAPPQVQQPPQAGPPMAQKSPTTAAPTGPPGRQLPGQRRPGLPATPTVKPPAGPQWPIDVPGADMLGPVIAMLMGLGVFLIAVVLVPYLFTAIMLFMIANKTHTPRPWLAFIPLGITQFLLCVEIAGKPIWFAAAFLLPFICVPIHMVLGDQTITSIAFAVGSLVFAAVSLLVSLGMANARGKSVVWGILLFLPCTSAIGLGYLGLSK